MSPAAQGDETRWRPWRAAVAAALLAWLVVAIWILTQLIDAERVFRNMPGHSEHNPFTGIGELLLPAMLLAVVAFIVVLVPRRLTLGWALVFIMSLIGIFAWLVLRGTAGDVPWSVRDQAALAVWMTRGLIAGLVAVSMLMLRGREAPPEVHAARQFGPLHEEHVASLAGGGSLGRQQESPSNAP